MSIGPERTVCCCFLLKYKKQIGKVWNLSNDGKAFYIAVVHTIKVHTMLTSWIL